MLPGWFTAVTEGSVTGEVAPAVDRSATSLGPPDGWPQPLRSAVELCFSTRFPVLVTWGPDLVMVYNDGYREMLGSEKHPSAMGAPCEKVWQEVWPHIAPAFEAVLTTGRATWAVDQMLTIHRSGYDEETYFTYSYSALRDEDGAVRGVLDIASETTDSPAIRRVACSWARNCPSRLTKLPLGKGDLAMMLRMSWMTRPMSPPSVLA